MPVRTRHTVGAARRHGERERRAPRAAGAMDDLEDDDPVEDKVPSVPIGVKKLRACLVSKIVKTEAQFLEEGCENVPELPIRGDHDAMLQCTTPHFDGCDAHARKPVVRARPPGARRALTAANAHPAPLPPPTRLLAGWSP